MKAIINCDALKAQGISDFVAHTIDDLHTQLVQIKCEFPSTSHVDVTFENEQGDTLEVPATKVIIFLDEIAPVMKPFS